MDFILLKYFAISLTSSDFSIFDDFTSDLIVLVAQTRSNAFKLALPEVLVLPAPMDPSASLEPAAPLVSPVFTLPEPSLSSLHVDWCWFAVATCTLSS